jgi:CheY-like chemotaxis protein
MTTNFEAEFPLLATAPMPSTKTLNRPARVLIAEDDWSLRDMLLFAFEDEGCEVVAVGDGSSLLDVLGSSMVPKSSVRPFDLVVSDLRMLDDLEELGHGPLVPPIVVITAFGSDAVHEQASRAGAVAVLDKPFDIPDLTALGRRVIARHSR